MSPLSTRLDTLEMTFSAFGEMPEELRAKIEFEKARSEMESSAVKATIVRFLRESDAETLQSIRTMLLWIQSAPNLGVWMDGVISSTLAARFGMCLFCAEQHETAEHYLASMTEEDALVIDPDILRVLDNLSDEIFEKTSRETIPDEAPVEKSKFEQMELDLGGASSSSAEKLDAETATIMRVTLFDFDPNNPTAEDMAAINLLNSAKPVPSLPLRDKFKEYSEAWGIEDLWDIDTNAFLGWRCVHCERGLWSTIQDRMLRPKGPDGCGGCRLKAAWG